MIQFKWNSLKGKIIVADIRAAVVWELILGKRNKDKYAQEKKCYDDGIALYLDFGSNDTTVYNYQKYPKLNA